MKTNDVRILSHIMTKDMLYDMIIMDDMGLYHGGPSPLQVCTVMTAIMVGNATTHSA